MAWALTVPFYENVVPLTPSVKLAKLEINFTSNHFFVRLSKHCIRNVWPKEEFKKVLEPLYIYRVCLFFFYDLDRQRKDEHFFLSSSEFECTHELIF